jgi:hypothetical protein
MIALL